uniref:Carbohydrate kinase PfkB domain-containing protein n=1 Tax=Amazona collaria TaxID=241587 RepID=A0A8B9IVI4_9PSIT
MESWDTVVHGGVAHWKVLGLPRALHCTSRCLIQLIMQTHNKRDLEGKHLWVLKFRMFMQYGNPVYVPPKGSGCRGIKSINSHSTYFLHSPSKQFLHRLLTGQSSWYFCFSSKKCQTDLALIQNNARVGSGIAVALSKLQKARRKGNLPRQEDTTPPQPVVIGGINVDFIAKAQNPVILGGGQTNAGRVRQTFGGVGRNLADCLSRLGQTPLFLSAVGKDEHSESVLRYCHHMDMTAILQLEGKNTATYCAVITSAGELSVGLGDMDIHHQITEQYVSQFKEILCQAPLVCIDGNVPLSTIQYVCQLAREHQIAGCCCQPLCHPLSSRPHQQGGDSQRLRSR